MVGGPAGRDGSLADTVLVSNRGPLSFHMEDGKPVAGKAGGGLAGTLAPMVLGTGATWVASAMGPADRQAVSDGLMTAEGLRIELVEPDPDVYDLSYNVVCNAALWFSPPPPLRRRTPAAQRPALGRGMGRLPRAQPAVRRKGGQGGAGGRAGPRPGLPPEPARPRAGRRPPGPADRPLHPHPVRRPVGAPHAAHLHRRRAPRRHGRVHGLRIPHRPLGGRLSRRAARARSVRGRAASAGRARDPPSSSHRSPRTSTGSDRRPTRRRRSRPAVSSTSESATTTGW